LIDETKIVFSGLDEVSQGKICPAQLRSQCDSPTNVVTPDKPTFSSALSFSDHDRFKKHLQARSEEIKSLISLLSSRAPKGSPDVTELQNQLSKKLAEEKSTLVQLETALADKQQLEERLDSASLRYMIAEKKIDRARSLTVAKLEKQQVLGPLKSGDHSSLKRDDGSLANGSTDASDRLVELEAQYNSTTAISEKQKEQLEQLEAENSKLLTQITELKTKVRQAMSQQKGEYEADGACAPDIEIIRRRLRPHRPIQAAEIATRRCH
jgi:E3 ubiquitin-protein ligase BRE1